MRLKTRNYPRKSGVFDEWKAKPGLSRPKGNEATGRKPESPHCSKIGTVNQCAVAEEAGGAGAAAGWLARSSASVHSMACGTSTNARAST